MSSKISGIDSTQITSVGAGRSVQRSQDAASGGPSSGTANDSSVQITGVARQLAELEQKVRDLPAINERRVSQLRAAIQQGTYAIKPQHIAGQLMSLDHALRDLPETDEPANAEK